MTLGENPSQDPAQVVKSVQHCERRRGERERARERERERERDATITIQQWLETQRINRTMRLSARRIKTTLANQPAGLQTSEIDEIRLNQV